MSPRIARGIAGVGLICWIAVTAAFALTALAIWQSLDHAQQAIEGDISGVVAALERAYFITEVASAPALVGIVSIYLGLFRWRARAKWLHVLGTVASYLSLAVVPTGTVLGILGLVHFRRRREEYLKA